MEDEQDFYYRIRSVAKSFEDRGLRTNGICGACESSTVLRRQNKNYLEVRCHVIGTHIAMDDNVMECSSFHAKNALRLHEMNTLGKVIDTRPGINDKAYK